MSVIAPICFKITYNKYYIYLHLTRFLLRSDELLNPSCDLSATGAERSTIIPSVRIPMKPIGLFIGLSVYLFFSVIWVLGDGEVQGPISVRRVPRKIRCTHPYLYNSSMRLSSLPDRVFTVTAFALSTHAYVVRSAPRKIAM